MMSTDEELTTLISNRYADTTLRVELEQIERRARQRQRNGRIATSAALAIATLATIGVTFAVVHRRPAADDLAAAFDAACQSIYSQEAQRTQRAGDLPATPGTPLIELRWPSTPARFRLYAMAGGSLRSMTFDCQRSATGLITGRLSYGAKGPAQQSEPLRAYRDTLPSGDAAIVGRLRDPSDTVQLSPPIDGVQLAVKDGYVVAWAPAPDIDRVVLALGTGPRIDFAQTKLALTATYQDAEFDRWCRREITDPDAKIALTYEGFDAIKVYLGRDVLATCYRTLGRDKPEEGLYLDGPQTAVTTSTAGTTEQSYGVMQMVASDYNSWIIGRTLPGTVRADVVTETGAVVQAYLANGVFLAELPTGESVKKLHMQTTTTVYTWAGGKMTKTGVR